VTPFRPVSEVRVRREGDALVVEHEGHAIRFRAVPVFEGDGVGFILSAENLYEEQYFATTFGGCGMTGDMKEWRLYDGKGKEKLIVRCESERAVTQIRDPATGIPAGYAIVYRPKLVAVFERPLSEGVVERLVEG
jgi:hypothetical protein